MDNKDKSLRLDQKARSFRISDNTFRDLPRLAVEIVLMSLSGLILVWLPMKLLPDKGRWIYCGFAVGFCCGILFGPRVLLRLRRVSRVIFAISGGKG